MRSIKFRGKFVYANADGSLIWIYGSLFQTDTLRNVGKVKIFKTVTYDGNTSITDNEVILGTVGQFTGIVDRNGVEIYEGDIIKDGKYLYIVEFDAPCFCARENGKNISYLLTLKENMQVVGNIYEDRWMLDLEV